MLLLLLVSAPTLRTTAVLFCPTDSLPFPVACLDAVQGMPGLGLCIVISPQNPVISPTFTTSACSCLRIQCIVLTVARASCSDGTLPSDTGNNTDPSVPTKPPPWPFRPASVYLAVLFLQHGVKEAGVGYKGQRWPLSLLFQVFAHCVLSCWQCQLQLPAPMSPPELHMVVTKGPRRPCCGPEGGDGDSRGK